MNRLVHRMTKFASLFYLGMALIGKSVAAAPLQNSERADPMSSRPLSLARSPASANPLLEFNSFDVRRPGVSILQAAEKPNPRWRLMGTCRQDIGMQRNVNGLGYGDCRN